MGAKTAANAKEKLTCEECKKEFQTVQALKSHMRTHSDKNKQMQSSVTESKDEKRTAFVPPTSRVSKRLQLKKSVDKEVADADENSNATEHKTVFECPLCLKVFQVYFSAQKHIQNRHAEDKDPMSPNSLDTFKPIRKEVCIVCGKQIYGEKHACRDVTLSIGESYVNGYYCCLGCKRHFLSVANFDAHVAANHSNDIVTMFFGSHNEFLLWKCNLESQLRVKYLTLSNTTPIQYYQCNYVSQKNSADITHLCPSVLVAREMSNGIQIQYYKTHYDHICNYKMPKQFESYIVNPNSNDNIHNRLLDTDDDLSFKFKNVMKSIALGAGRLNLVNLRKLYVAALKMQVNFNSYIKEQNVELRKQNLGKSDNESSVSIDQEETTDNNEKSDVEIVIANKSMSDDQITQVLEQPKARESERLKRKSERSTPPVLKKQKLNSDDDASKKSESKENNFIISDLRVDSPKVTKTTPVTQSPSFNDTYKEFIGSHVNKNTIEPALSAPSTPPPSSKKLNNADPMVATVRSRRINNINPLAASPSPKNQKAVSPSFKNQKAVSLSPNQEAVSPSPKNKEAVSPSPKNKDSPRVITKKAATTPQSTKKTNKKEIVKTKIGQFVPSPEKKATQPKVHSENVEKVVKKKLRGPKSARRSIADVNLEEVEYEVVQQENDCNILVLKF